MRNLKSLRAATLLASLLTISLPLSAQTSNDQIQALREQIQQLDQKLRILERQDELRREAATTAAAAAPVVAAGPAAFSLTSGDRLFQLRIAGLLHADARFYGSDAPASDTFLLRRVRLTFQGTFNGKFGFRITPEFAGNNATLLDATVSYAASPAFNVLVGKAKSPFDLERLISGGSIRFIERGYPTILGPNRDIGIQIIGDVLDRRLNYALAWGNGTGDNGSSVTNSEADTELALRLFAQPFIADSNSPLAGLGFGVAFTYGDKSAGAPAGYSTLAQQGFFAWNSGIANSGRHFRWSPQGHFFIGPLGLVASYVESSQELTRAGVERTVWNKGYLVQATYVLTGEVSTLRGVTPAKAFNLGGDGWGAFEVAARISALTVGSNAFTGAPGTELANAASSARRATGYTGGLNWYLNRNVKAVLNYEFTDFEGGGNGAAGPGAVTADDEHAVFARAQVSF